MVGVEIVAQQGGLERAIAGGILLQPAFGGGDFAVLFGVAILRGDELRAQRDGLGLAGSDDDRGERAVIEGFLSVFMFHAGAVGAMELFRRVVPGAIQGDGNGVMNGAIRLEHPLVGQSLEDMVVKGQEFPWRDRIESLTDMVVRGD